MNGQNTLRHLLDNPLAEVPEELVGSEDRSKLGSFLSRFPSDFSSCVLLERLLADTDDGVDVTLLLEAGGTGRGMLAGTNEGLPETWFESPAWRHARLLAQGEAEWVLLEVDAEQFPEECPVPHLFLSPGRRGLKAATHELSSIHSDEPALDISGSILEQLQSLPAAHGLCLMGRMIGRGHKDVRILVTFESLEDLKTCLATVNWPGDPFSQPGFELIPNDANCYLLNLEVGSSVRRRIGIEPYFWFFDDKRATRRWNSYLSSLEESQLCTPDEAQALRRFPGAQGDGLRCSVSTKMVFDEDLRVKAYLSIDGGN